MKRYSESEKNTNQVKPKTRNQYAKSRARYVEERHAAAERRQKNQSEVADT